jgi:hypothetical protein
MKKFTDFLYALFFTRDDDLDVLQVLFAVIVMQTLYIVTKLTLQYPEMSEAVRIESLVTLRWLTGLLVITAVPKWLVPFISSHTKNIGNSVNKKTDTIEEIPEATEENSH